MIDRGLEIVYFILRMPIGNFKRVRHFLIRVVSKNCLETDKYNIE